MEILNTKRFNFDEAATTAGWQKELEGDHHTPETEEYGIASFVFRDPKPFNPERLWTFLNNEYPASIIRAKGLFWLASRPNDAINFSQAGGSLRVETAGVWWCSMPYQERIEHPSFLDFQKAIEQRWDKTWGDRMNEIVFIGQDMDQAKITADLQKCLISDMEILLFEREPLFPDPFPQDM